MLTTIGSRTLFVQGHRLAQLGAGVRLTAAQSFEDAANAAADGGDHGVVRVTAAVELVRHVLVPLVGELVPMAPSSHAGTISCASARMARLPS